MPAATTVPDLVAFHLERARILAEADPDVLLFETLAGLREARAAVEVAERLGHDGWITVTTPDGAHTTDGEPLDELVPLVAGSDRITAVGINCSPPETVLPALAHLGDADTRLVARPNAGATWERGAWRDPTTRASRTELPARWHRAGASIIGGCCGTSAEDVAVIASGLR